ncbi:MAG TPA: heterodisulfide reductase-related iron-sulfur binding cluster [Thermoproteota archaeon]|nr:heterodisulfide reductase-related iron-sulfur binding cluster [Thermoproteota archaeon]
MTAYSLYLGCVIPTQFPHVERAVRDVMIATGTEVSEMKGASCCAPNHLFGISRQAWLALNKRNLGLASGTIVTACDECFASLQDARLALSEGGKGLPDVKPFLTFLSENDAVLRQKSRKLGLRCAVQHSCHLLRPSKVRKADDPENPLLMRNALDAIGCSPIQHEAERDCCGGQASGPNGVGRKLADRKVLSARTAGADLIVTSCAHCLRNLSRPSGEIPVLDIAQLYAFALGSEPSKVGLPEQIARSQVKRQ